MSTEAQQASFRTHPLRGMQKSFQGYTPHIIAALHRGGWLEGTAVDKVLTNGDELHPDDITLAGLEITARATRDIIEHGGVRPTLQWAFGWSMDGLDGAYARHLDLSSPEGAVKDVLADRAAEAIITREILEELGYPKDGNRFQELQAAFNLSTLTKAAAEMTGIITYEGGQGGMMHRRRTLLGVLRKVHTLRQHRVHSNANKALKTEIDIDNRLRTLVEDSRYSAFDRALQIAYGLEDQSPGWDNMRLHDPNSAEAIEARKYTAIVEMNRRLGVDMIRQLNTLGGGNIFPDTNSLSENFDYTNSSQRDIEPFMEQALEIVRPTPLG